MLCYKLSKSIHNEIEKLILNYIQYLSVANCIYIAICMFRNRFWVIYNTDIFAYILGISFVAILVHIACKRGNK